MSLLLDTNVVSEWSRPSATEAVKRLVNEAGHLPMYISVISIGEIRYGIERLANGRRKVGLLGWVAELELDYEDKIIPVDLQTAKVWGEITARLHSQGNNFQAGDSWIAATAIRHGMKLATRNERDFAGTGVAIINPWNF